MLAQTVLSFQFIQPLIFPQDSEGSTPLHFACLLEQVKHAELLLEYGADVTKVNSAGQYPLQMLPRDAVRSTKLYLKRLFEVSCSSLPAAVDPLLVSRKHWLRKRAPPQ
jgi:ankyrin repeat protein